MWLLPICLCAQATVHGYVKDSTGALPFVNVYLESVQDSTVLLGSVTNEAGYFTLKPSPGKYRLQASFVGYQKATSWLVIQGDTLLGDLYLHKTAQQIEGVTVASTQPMIERLTDRLVFNVSQAIAAQDATAWDALMVAPGLNIRNNQLAMVGKSGLAVMVNGRAVNLSADDLAAMLRTMPSNDIEKIEVITMPPAQYEAQGNSGIVNIVTKKRLKDHLNGFAYLQMIQASHLREFAGAQVAYRKNKLSGYANITGSHGSNGPRESYQIDYPDRDWDSFINKRTYTPFATTSMGLDYELNPASNIGFQYTGSMGSPRSVVRVDNQLRTVGSQALDSTIVSDTDARLHTGYHMVNAHYQVNLDTVGTTWSWDVDAYQGNNDENRQFVSNNFLPGGELIPDSQQSADIQTDNEVVIYAAKTNLTFTLGKTAWVTGAKVSHSKNYNRIAFYDTEGEVPRLDSSQSFRFTYVERIQAAYLSGTRPLGESFELQLGLRAENTQADIIDDNASETIENNYFKLFPTAYLSASLGQNHHLSLSYGRRVNRPPYALLNPFRLYRNPFSYVEGNPALQPSFTHNLELSYVYKHRFVTTLYASKTNDGFESTTFVSPGSDIQVTRPVNFLTQYDAGLSQTASFEPTGWWQSYSQAYLYYAAARSELPQAPDGLDGVSAYVSTNNTFTLNQKGTVKAEANFWYQFAERLGIEDAKPMYNLSLGLRLNLLKHTTITLKAVDLFKTNEYRAYTRVNGIRQFYTNYQDNRQFSLSINYQFWNKKLKAKGHSGSIADERGRL